LWFIASIKLPRWSIANMAKVPSGWAHCCNERRIPKDNCIKKAPASALRASVALGIILNENQSVQQRLPLCPNWFNP
jgi:hypothetical protein